MPLSGEAKKAYQRAYMKRRYWEEKAFREKAALRAAKRVMRLALNRVERARAIEEANPGSVDERRLNLAWQYNQLMGFETEPARKHNRRGDVRVGVKRWQPKKHD